MHSYGYSHQRFLPNDPLHALEVIGETGIPVVISKKRRIRKDYSGRVYEIVCTHDGTWEASYSKRDFQYPIHTKVEYNREVHPTNLPLGFPSVVAGTAILDEFTNEEWQRKIQLIARIYDGENLGVILIGIRALLEGYDDIEDEAFFEVDHRKLIPKTVNARVVQLFHGSSPIPDGSPYHDNKLAKNPANGWGKTYASQEIQNTAKLILARNACR
ncbi:MAG: hypothetical protein HHAS10_07120 [Candidatus Altimarinota bacterium]